MITETLKNPNVVTLPNPIGIDRAIQNVQLSLGTLTWLEKSFGRAWTIPRNEPNGAKIAEPMLYQGTKEYYPALPNDALKSYSFFRVPSSRSTAEYAANLNNRSYMFIDPVDLIVWADLRDIDPTKDYVYKEELIREVLDRLNLDPNVEVVRIWDDKVEDIFKGYSLNPTHRDLLMYPYTAFRIEMTLRYSILCDGLPIGPPPSGGVSLTAELLKVSGGLDATLKSVVGGNGNTSPLQLSTTKIGISGYTADLVLTLQGMATQIQAQGYALTAENNAKAYADTLVVGLLDDRGNYDASSNLYPSTGGSGPGGDIRKGDLWTISVGGLLNGVAVTAGDVVRALADTPGQVAANWVVTENNIGYVPVSLITDQTITGRKIFTADATRAGINFGSVSAAPSTLVNGDAWYNSTAGFFYGRANNVTQPFVMVNSLFSLSADQVVLAANGGTLKSSANLTYAGTLVMINSRANFSSIASQPNNNATTVLSLRGNTTNILTGENNAGNNVFVFSTTGVFTLGSQAGFFPSNDGDTLLLGGVGLVANVAPGGVGFGVRVNTNVTGSITGFRMAGSFVPTSGSGNYNGYVCVPTINQTATSNGEIVYFNASATVTNVLGKIVAYRHNSGFVQWNSIVSPSSISTDQTDYNPPSWTTGAAPGSASIMRLTSSGAVSIKSLLGGFTGRLGIILNAGAFNITLTNDDGATGTATARFSIPANRVLAPNDSVLIWYDGTSTCWRIIS